MRRWRGKRMKRKKNEEKKKRRRRREVSDSSFLLLLLFLSFFRFSYFSSFSPFSSFFLYFLPSSHRPSDPRTSIIRAFSLSWLWIPHPSKYSSSAPFFPLLIKDRRGERGRGEERRGMHKLISSIQLCKLQNKINKSI